MSLTWRDGIGTLLVGSTGVVAYARAKTFDWPLLHSWRMATAVLLVVGLASCTIIGSGVVPTKDIWTKSASVLGGTAFVLALVGLIANSKWAFFGLAANIIALWVLTTTHHAIT